MWKRSLEWTGGLDFTLIQISELEGRVYSPPLRLEYKFIATMIRRMGTIRNKKIVVFGVSYEYK
ncbi:hypothetical protein DVH24_016131 [Malus domestica]|uniref:Uncharacterized protein n=1 Tax=Malus domestica TaxID=3750 RepID=A0A498JJD5_MALDO|nr:hypothetical protein DVH24_016131 [Malus domestica]